LEKYLQGIGVSPGIAIAPSLKFSHDRYDVPEYTILDMDAEQKRLHTAIEATRADLTSIYNHTVEGLGKTHAEIFRAHLMILDDVALRSDILDGLKASRQNVEFILHNLN